MSNVSSGNPTSPITLPLETLTPGALQIIQTAGGAMGFTQSRALGMTDVLDLRDARTALHGAEADAATYILKNLQELRPKDSIIINYKDHDATYPQPEAKLTWYVKPLDGIQNFEHGYSLFTIALSAVDNSTGKTRFTGIYSPQYQRIWWTSGGKPWRKRGRRQREEVLKSYDFSDLTVIATNYPRDHDLRQDYLGMLPGITDRFEHLRMLGSGTLQGILVAEGRMNALVEFDVKPASYLPTRELIRLTDGLSELLTLRDGSTALVAARRTADFDFLTAKIRRLC